MEGLVARGRMSRHLDLERRHAKQAEARLRQHLQRLERTCLYHLRLLSWEQKQLRRERERLQQPDIRSKCPASSGNGFQQRPGDATVCPAQGERCGAPRASGRRAQATTNPTRGTRKNGSQEPPSRDITLQDPEEGREPLPSQSSAASDVREEKPVHQATSPEPARPDLGATPTGDLGGVGSGDAPPSPRATGREGNSDSEAPAPSLPQLLARAANARYLRHRVPPESERVLSLPEIFGHGGPATHGRAASRSPPL
ncbi:coiled-coil domain-containing protein 190 [Artibeus jamaicensis]|uniref:coiled-coil domain-containing protein 190 n=1 Tax=Artibeus jamaicensis TaxID=9417 RepID=UPI00235A825E|nr:coiled-coil domain-containing protein 190 [Artibeus jamaicensis]